MRDETEIATWIHLHGERFHIDGALAPRMTPAGLIRCVAEGETQKDRNRIASRTHECEQGKFLRHELPSGFTAIQWWDRCQGDRRGGSNSTILLEGVHNTEAMLLAIDEFFPTVRDNLDRNGIDLVEVTRG